MQINLKQSEIVEALKQYVSRQGINLAGKDVAIAFTAGRKESGISAEISIEDADIPDFFGGEPNPPALQVVHATTPAVADSVANTVGDSQEPEIQKAPQVEPEPPVAEAPTKVSSLFS